MNLRPELNYCKRRCIIVCLPYQSDDLFPCIFPLFHKYYDHEKLLQAKFPLEC